MNHYFHSGDLGDVIYSLPTIQAYGRGILFLYDTPEVKTMHGMTAERFVSIVPLLMRQDCIVDVRWVHPGNLHHISLNAFRFKGFDLAHENLADLYLKTAGFPTLFRESRWLWAPKQRMASVVISRSARYHNPDFPWKKVMDAFGQHAVFVGTPAEHAAFVQQFGSVNYAYTPDLLVAASIINAADLFIGNQSCPLAIAHGLGKRVLIEVCPYCPNCIFDRPDEYTKLEDVCLNGFREPSSIKVPCTAS